MPNCLNNLNENNCVDLKSPIFFLFYCLTILIKNGSKFYKSSGNVSGYADDVASSLMSTLRYDGYEVDGVKLPSGEWDISVHMRIRR